MMPTPDRIYRRAPFGARFVFALLILLVSGAAGARCLSDRIDDRVRVRYVIDGDTVELATGRRLRLIGFDTPELGHDGAVNEPYALEARNFLRRLLFTHHQTLSLRLDVERRDRYGRQLAHAFLDDGRSVAEEILQAGLATRLVVPPNLWQFDCYVAAERRALKYRRGLWTLPAYQVSDSRSVNADVHGFRRVRGRIVRIGESAGAIWLNLAGQFAVRIPRRDLRWFGNVDPRSWLNRSIVVRGDLYTRKNEARVTVRHPASIRVLN